ARFKQAEESAKVAARYRALCLSTSEGKDPDVFRLELGAEQRAHPPRGPEAPVFDGSIVGLGVELVKAKLRSDSRTDALETYAEILAYHLSALKGPIMKLGQVLSFYGVTFPEDSRALLSLLQDSAAAVPFATMQGVLESELGTRTDDVFAYLDDVPLAVG